MGLAPFESILYPKKIGVGEDSKDATDRAHN